jgi:hypothetical protein
MTRSLLVALALAGMWSLAAAGPARADRTVPGLGERWSYATSGTPGDAGAPAVVFIGEQGTRFGSHQILAATVLSFNNFSQPVVLDPNTVHETIFIRDGTSGETGSATFDFQMSGRLSSSAAWLAMVPQGPTSHTLHLGQYYYTISADPFRPPEDASRLAGRLFFDVAVRHNPEPSSLILAGLGLSLVGARVRRRRRTA